MQKAACTVVVQEVSEAEGGASVGNRRIELTRLEVLNPPENTCDNL
jgi:hypothetical protein